MSEAAPQAASMSGGEIDKALEALRLQWDDSYTFGYDPDKGWWVIRDGRLGSLLTADTPEELARLLGETRGTGW